MKPRILFIIKRRVSYGVAYGLANSCRFVAQTLADEGVTVKVVEVVDNNEIDREVTAFKPTHVFIEALWVIPSKFKELGLLHPQVKWYVRIHSNTPFLGTEGIAFDWIINYNKLRNVRVACNSARLVNELKQALGISAAYAPNIYPLPSKDVKDSYENTDTIRIGCFGAIRPFKNHLEQALAAITFANIIGKHLKFYVNQCGAESLGEPFIKNLRSIFAATNHSLIEKDWTSHEEFITLVKKMDIGMQVSLSETFNIVAADFVANDIPVVGSPEIEWLSSFYQADPTDMSDIVRKLYFAWSKRWLDFQRVNRWGLKSHNEDALDAWLQLLFP